MPLVDEVWGRMEFRTPWSRAREREAVGRALARFVAWHERPGARTVLATEPRVRAEVALPDGQVVRLARLRRPARARRGRPGGGRRPQDRQVPTHRSRGRASTPSSGSTSSPSTTAPPTSWPGRPVTSGGAELVQLRIGDGLPKVQAQEPQEPGDGARAGREPADAGGRARRAPRSSWPGPAPHCDRCAVHRHLPRQGRRDGAVMTPVDIHRRPEQLARADAARTSTFSPQQFAAITAPLEPAVVIAGAGSGKTTVMAARVVWLVATGQVRAGRDPRPDLHHQGDRRARQPGPRAPASRPGCSARGERRRRGRRRTRRGGRGADGRDVPLLRRRRCSPSTACGSATSPTPG